MFKLLMILFCVFSLFADFKTPLFIPPPTWELSAPKKDSEYVQVNFIGVGSTRFRPSLNLSIEKTNASQKEYLKAVKSLYAKETDTVLRDLGNIKMGAGVGRLIELQFENAYGKLRMQQALFVQKGRAYILTATALKEEFGQFQKEILKSFQSFNLYSDLLSAIPKSEDKKKLTEFFEKLKTKNGKDPLIEKQAKLHLLENEILTNSFDLGGHFQYLALQEGIKLINESCD